MISLDELLDEVRQGHRTLPRGNAVRLLRASIRVAAATRVPLRPRMLLLDEHEELTLDPTPPAAGADDRPGYAAPEVNVGLAPPDDPQALVYTAGALGYELLTLRPVPDRAVPPSTEVPPWLAAILARALAPRHRRFQTLDEMEGELESAEPERPIAESLETQLRAAEARAAELEHTITARDIAAAERTAELQLTIDALQERVRLLTYIANAAAEAPRRGLVERPSSGSRRRARPLVVGSIILMVMTAIAASIFAIRNDGPSREAIPVPSDAQLIQNRPEPSIRR